MKKKIICGVGIVLSLAVLYLVLGIANIVPLPKWITESLSAPEPTTNDRIARMVKETYPTDIVLLGDTISFDADIPVRSADAISEAALQSADRYEYTYFIINNLDDEMQLSENDVALLKTKIAEEGFCLLYLGENAWDGTDAAIAGNLSWVDYTWNGIARGTIGIWTKEDAAELSKYPHMLSDAVLLAVEDYLLEMNQTTEAQDAADGQ